MRLSGGRLRSACSRAAGARNGQSDEFGRNHTDSFPGGIRGSGRFQPRAAGLPHRDGPPAPPHGGPGEGKRALGGAALSTGRLREDDPALSSVPTSVPFIASSTIPSSSVLRWARSRPRCRCGGDLPAIASCAPAGSPPPIASITSAASSDFHGLLRTALTRELQSGGAEAESELHRRASTWYVEHEDPDRAVEHLIAAGDVERAGDLIYTLLPDYAARGRNSTVISWISRFTERQVESCTPLALAAFHSSLAGGREAAQRPG